MDDDIVPPQGTEGLLDDLQPLIAVQPSEPPLQDTVLPSEAIQRELRTGILRANPHITLAEVSATATDSEAQRLITPRNVGQPLRNTHGTNTENASESPAEIMNPPYVDWADPRVVGRPGTTHPSTPSPDQETADAVGANQSSDGNDPERRLSGVNPPVTDGVVADGHNTTQTPQQPLTAPPNNQAHPSVGDAETDLDNPPSPASQSQAAIDGGGSNRDASSSKTSLLSRGFSGVKGFRRSLAMDAAMYAVTYVSNGAISIGNWFQACHTRDEIIDMAAHAYNLEHLKTGLTESTRGKRWKCTLPGGRTWCFRFLGNHSTTVPNGACFSRCSCGVIMDITSTGGRISRRATGRCWGGVGRRLSTVVGLRCPVWRRC